MHPSLYCVSSVYDLLGRNEIVSYILRTLPPSTSARVQSPSALSRSQVTEDHHRKTLVGMLTQRNVRGWSPLHYMMMFALESDRHVQCAKTILESICKLRSNAWARKVIDSSFGCAPSPTTILSHVTKTILHLHSNVERGQNEAFKRMSEQANELKQMCNSFCIPREAKPLSPVWLPISYSTQVHKELSSDLKVGWGEIKRTFDEGICAPLSTDISNGKYHWMYII